LPLEREPDGNNEGNKDDNNKYGKDGNIPNKLFNFFHTTTNQKHVGVTEGGWDRPHNCARTLGERDGNDEGNKDDTDKYGKDGNIPNDDDKYAGGRQTMKKYTATNQKHAGSMGERQDMRRNRRGVWWWCELIILGQSSWDSVKN
jgi:hypothetical protein